MKTLSPLFLIGALLLSFAAIHSAKAAPSPVAAASPALVGDDKEALSDALKALKRAAGRDDLDKRKAALEAVVALGNPDALNPLLARLVTAAAAAGKAEEGLINDQITLERKRVQLAELKLALEQNEDLAETVKDFEKELKDLEKKMDKARTRVDLEGPWRDALRKGLGTILSGLGTGKLRGLTKDIWKTFEKGDDSAARLAAAWLLADLGESGTAARFARVMTDVLDDRIKLKKELPELEAKLHEWERKLQEELDKTGQNTNGTGAGYERARSDAAEKNRELLVLERFARSLAGSAGRALRMEENADEGVATLLKLARKSAHQAQLLDALVLSGREEAKVALAAELPVAKGDLFKRLLVDGLAKMGAKLEAEPWLLESGLASESWMLRAHVIDALAALRSREAVPKLIELLGNEEGRLRTEIGDALTSLTGTDYHGNVILWQRWWKDHEADFEVPAVPPATGEDKALESVGLTFFGLRTESQKVLFVLDVSGSMEFLMKNYSSGSEGEKRITVAKRELLRALGGIPDGGTFNIVLYASDVWTWSDEPVIMDEATRAEATEFVNGIKANGGTNIYGAMKLGLGRARGKAKKKKPRGAPQWTPPVYDTVFLLSDGVPSVGVSIAREDILDMVAEENSDLGVEINTIGLSTDQDAVLMRKLAEQSGGNYAAR